MNFKTWKWVEIILIWGAIVSGLKKSWLKWQSLLSLEGLVKNAAAWNMRKTKNIKKNTFLNIFDASIRQQSGQIVKSRPIGLHLTHIIWLICENSYLIRLMWYWSKRKFPFYKGLIWCSFLWEFLGFLHEKLERRTNLITGKLHIFNKKKTILTELIDIMDALHGDCFQVTNKDMIESEHSLTYLFVAYWQGF